LIRQKTFDVQNLADIKRMGMTIIIDQKTIII